MYSGDDIWDEDRWEAFLRESDKRVSRYMDLLFGFLTDHPPPDVSDTEAYRAWREQLKRFLRENGFEYDPGFSETHDADEGTSLFDVEEMAFEPDDVEALESFRDIPVYRKAFDLATQILEWTNALPGDVKDSALVQFCSSITQVPANIAKGHGIGYELDTIGGNIACAKRALNAANSALDLLREMKPAAYMEPDFYRNVYEQTYEVRNMLGLYVQDLRARFNLGID